MALNLSSMNRVIRKALLIQTAALCVVSAPAMSAIVSCPFSNIVVPQTVDGLFVNLVTGITGPTEAAVPGWDFNPWGSSNSYFWFSTGGGGVVADGTTAPFLVLSPGDTVGPMSTFSGPMTSASTSFRVIDDGYLGFRFLNESTGVTNYAYAHMHMTPPTGLPATLVSCAYEDTGNAITVDDIFSDDFE